MLLLMRDLTSNRVFLMLRITVDQLLNRLEYPKEALLRPTLYVSLIVLLFQLGLRVLKEIPKLPFFRLIFNRIVGLCDVRCIFIEKVPVINDRSLVRFLALISLWRRRIILLSACDGC